jgi:hypothetical protein
MGLTMPEIPDPPWADSGWTPPWADPARTRGYRILRYDAATGRPVYEADLAGAPPPTSEYECTGQSAAGLPIFEPIARRRDATQWDPATTYAIPLAIYEQLKYEWAVRIAGWVDRGIARVHEARNRIEINENRLTPRVLHQLHAYVGGTRWGEVPHEAGQCECALCVGRPGARGATTATAGEAHAGMMAALGRTTTSGHVTEAGVWQAGPRPERWEHSQMVTWERVERLEAGWREMFDRWLRLGWVRKDVRYRAYEVNLASLTGSDRAALAQMTGAEPPAPVKPDPPTTMIGDRAVELPEED